MRYKADYLPFNCIYSIYLVSYVENQVLCVYIIFLSFILGHISNTFYINVRVTPLPLVSFRIIVVQSLDFCMILCISLFVLYMLTIVLYVSACPLYVDHGVVYALLALYMLTIVLFLPCLSFICWPLCCMSLVCPLYVDCCVVCAPSIHRFWLPLILPLHSIFLQFVNASFNNIPAISYVAIVFIREWNRSTRKKPPTYSKSLTQFIT